MPDYQCLVIWMPLKEIVALNCQACQLVGVVRRPMSRAFGAYFGQLLHTGQPVVAQAQMSQIWEVFDSVERGQRIVAQKQLLHFCKLESERLLLHR